MPNLKVLKNVFATINVLTFFFNALPLEAFEWSATSRLSIVQEYNDNLYQDNEDQEEDFITVITPGIQGALDWQRCGLTAAYDLGYSVYNEHSENDGFRHRGDAGWWWNVSQYTRMTLGDTYIQSEDISDLPENDAGRDRREGYYSNSARVGLDHRFGENKNVSFRYAYGILNNDDPLVEDNENHQTSIDSTYYFSPYWGTEMHASHTKGLYDVSQDFDEWEGAIKLLRNLTRHFQINGSYRHTVMNWEGNGIENDYQVYNPTAGIQYNFSEDGLISLNFGYFVQDIDTRDNEKGMTIDGNVGRTWRFRGGTFSLKGSSGYENSELNTENLGFNVYYGAETRLEYKFRRNFGSSIHALYRHNDYVNPDPGELERKDNYAEAGCSLDWQIKRWLGTGIDYTFRTMNSNIDDNDYNVNRVMLRIVLSSQYGRLSNGN